jgi:hypothetical protein
MLVDPLAPYGMRIPPDITAWINAQQGNPEGIRQILELLTRFVNEVNAAVMAIQAS